MLRACRAFLLEDMDTADSCRSGPGAADRSPRGLAAWVQFPCKAHLCKPGDASRTRGLCVPALVLRRLRRCGAMERSCLQCQGALVPGRSALQRARMAEPQSVTQPAPKPAMVR